MPKTETSRKSKADNSKVNRKQYGPGGGKRNPLQREDDKIFIKNLYLQGFETREIAAEIGKIRPYTLSHVTVAASLLEIKSDMEAQLSMEVKGHMSEMIAAIKLQKKELWAAWHKSKRNQEKTERHKERGKAASTKTSSTVRDGTRGFHTELRKLNDQLRAILGLDQPKRQILQDAKGAPLEFVIRLAESELP